MGWYENPPIPREFIWRRLHSLIGLGLVIFIIFHLLTNSQAALLIGHDGRGFIYGVNAIQAMPFVIILEIVFLGIPILLHTVWGIQYIFKAKYNSFKTDGSKPYLSYGRNKAYTLQRLTSWILLVGIVAHVVHMRFYEHPTMSEVGDKLFYMIKVNNDPGLDPLSERLGYDIYDQARIEEYAKTTNLEDQKNKTNHQLYNQEKEFLKSLKEWSLKKDQVVVVTHDFGTAELVMLRDQFKSPLIMILYTIFVLAAVFHAFNGLWTFLITWGIILTLTSQQLALKFTKVLMFLMGFLGLATIWLTYWVNLKN